MYKLLLAWRYLRSRYIALASVISVTLGVATLIVVNSVMAGFSKEMHERLHGVLSDIVVETSFQQGIRAPDAFIHEVRQVLGDDVEAVAAVVQTPAMLSYPVGGRWSMQQVRIVGMDPDEYSKVSDFGPFLLHPENQKRLTFELKEKGYGVGKKDEFPLSGWDYRRRRARVRRSFTKQTPDPPRTATPTPPVASQVEGNEGSDVAYLEIKPPKNWSGETIDLDNSQASASGPATSTVPTDPFAKAHEKREGGVFDPAQHQHTGVVLGIGLSARKIRDADTGEVKDMYFVRPGDDIQLSFPGVGTPPTPQHDTFTVVDFYESGMSEYDAGFVFVPIERLQKMRGMGDSATSIQIKLKEGTDLTAAKQKLVERFPPQQYQLHIQTWREMRAPLLSAVQLETTILNILLFLIIAVAGFGILATFFMIVVEKTRDIGILKALGAPDRGVMSIFLSYGLCLGCVGSGVGMVLGLLFVNRINVIKGLLERLTGQEVFDETIYYFNEIPTTVEPLMVAFVVAGAVLIAVMASILPARHAARLHPVEALRYE